MPRLITALLVTTLALAVLAPEQAFACANAMKEGEADGWSYSMLALGGLWGIAGLATIGSYFFWR